MWPLCMLGSVKVVWPLTPKSLHFCLLIFLSNTKLQGELSCSKKDLHCIKINCGYFLYNVFVMFSKWHSYPWLMLTAQTFKIRFHIKKTNSKLFFCLTGLLVLCYLQPWCLFVTCCLSPLELTNNYMGLVYHKDLGQYSSTELDDRVKIRCALK